jgi:predicted nucleic acid-binding protein
MKSVIVDTSVWRQFFAGRAVARRLGALLEEDGLVLVHPLVVGELVLGGLSVREEQLLQSLPSSDRVPYDEVLDFVRRRRLMRKGIGWVDAELIASALTSGANLWSLDGALAEAARELGAAL